MTIPIDRTRVSFAVPWQGLLLLGTTDTPWDGRPGRRPCDRRGRAADPRRGRLGARRRSARCAPASPGSVCSPRAPARLRECAARRCSRAARSASSPSRAGSSRPTAGSRSPCCTRCAPTLGLHRIDREPRQLPGAADPEVAADALRRRHGLDGRRRRTWRARTARSRPTSWRSGRSSRSWTAPPSSPPRCATRASTSGRSPSRTSSAAARRSRSAGSTRPSCAPRVEELLA